MLSQAPRPREEASAGVPATRVAGLCRSADVAAGDAADCIAVENRANRRSRHPAMFDRARAARSKAAARVDPASAAAASACAPVEFRDPTARILFQIKGS